MITEWINYRNTYSILCNPENELTNVATVVVSKDNQMRRAKPIFSEPAISRESATVTWILAEAQRQAEEWENYSGKKGKCQVCPDDILLAWESCRQAT